MEAGDLAAADAEGSSTWCNGFCRTLLLGFIISCRINQVKVLVLDTVLTEELIQMNLAAADWEEALRAGGALLLAAGKCTPGYVDAMVGAVRERGPYMVLAPGIALAHARPEDGAREVGMSLVTLKQAVRFGSAANDPVWLVVTFCAVDGDIHVGLLKALADFLRDPENQRRLRQAQTVEAVLHVLAGGE